jgi:hypothetical protein
LGQGAGWLEEEEGEEEEEKKKKLIWHILGICPFIV